ncbi:TetR-like C-terminal domain-containing protein [Streptomyces sp. NPDC020858]|uniref:TetR-like C-terminal domain-containing protein n=1 Tax=Streptomyces sp. NPDC020858 TaxID=3365097 RepID=UPI0037B2CBEE
MEQPSTVGWNALTMEGGAAGAYTGKAALCRCRPSKADLVAAAHRTGPQWIGEIPDGGSIREHLHLPCVRTPDAVHSSAGQALRWLLHECDHAHPDRFREVVWSGPRGAAWHLIRGLALRGIERGGVWSDASSPFVVDVIPATLMYRTMMCGSE